MSATLQKFLPRNGPSALSIGKDHPELILNQPNHPKNNAHIIHWQRKNQVCWYGYSCLH